jgi:hypothetical protein
MILTRLYDIVQPIFLRKVVKDFNTFFLDVENCQKNLQYKKEHIIEQ